MKEKDNSALWTFDRGFEGPVCGIDEAGREIGRASCRERV